MRISPLRSEHQFLGPPVSVPSALAALQEPLLAVLCLVLAHVLHREQFDGAAVTLAMLVLVLMFPGVNRYGRSDARIALEVARSWLGVLGVLALLALATHGHQHFKRALLMDWIIATPALQWIAFAAGTRLLLSSGRMRHAQRPAVIVGTEPMGAEVARMLHARSHLGHKLLGCFDDRAQDRVALPDGVPLLGTLAELPGYLDRHAIADVFIVLPLTPQPRIAQLIDALQNSTASLHFVPNVAGIDVIQGCVETIEGVPVLSLRTAPYTGASGLLKRASDLVFSSAILLMIAPVLLVVAIGVKLSSPGPVIFRQRRTGLNGEVIEVYKFRSMTVQDDGPVVQQARRNDPRVTPFGAFIRRTSLDELPQFINVLQGRMSIVGPRPHALAHNDQYRALVKAYMARHKVKPGITGWAQVNGLRGETDTLDKMARRVEYDLQYLRHWSIGLDLLIILRTAKQVFINPHVY